MKINIETNNQIPEGFPLVTYQGRDYLEPMVELKSIFNLRHSVFDKLGAIPIFTRLKHRDVRNVFSDEDIIILKKIYKDIDISVESKCFIKRIIEHNLVRYKDAPLKNTRAIIDKAKIEFKSSQTTFKTFTKWFSLSGYNLNDTSWRSIKIKTILAEKIYMPFPDEFNDIFDCQLHLNDNDLLKLANNEAQNFPMAKYLYLFSKFSFIINSFSLNVPENTESNHMWGLYGDKGSGIALTYNLDHLIALIKNNYAFNNYDVISPEKIIHVDLVNYKDKHNPNNEFKKCLDEYCGKNNKLALQNFFQNFIYTKTYQWQFEKELRFFKFSQGVFKNITSIDTTNIPILERYIEEEKSKTDHEFDFIRPVLITLGWNCNTENEDIKNLIQHAKKNLISIRKLNKFINYEFNQFYYNNF